MIYDRVLMNEQLVALLKQIHELHIRWSTSKSYESIAPFVSRITPGLHVTYTPSQGKSAYSPFHFFLQYRILSLALD
jgi:hypothetical protein